MNENMYKKQYCYSLFRNFGKILSELELVYSLNHSAEKGRESEEILKSFLNEYLPKKYSITTGFVNSDLGVSNQCDIIIYDPSNVAPIFSGYVNKIINVITVKAILECKMNLNSKEVLKKEDAKFENVKKMFRLDERVKSLVSSEPLTVLFAYKSFGNRGSFVEKINGLKLKNIDIIFCADKGLYYFNKDSNKYSAISPPLYFGTTSEGYNASLENHGFAIFYSYLLDRLKQINCDYDNYSMMQQYSESSIQIDYIDN